MPEVQTRPRDPSANGRERLADFILANVEPILADWVTFARSTMAGGKMNAIALRDHAEDILRATAKDMRAAQTDEQQAGKSKGVRHDGPASRRLEDASQEHAVGRVNSGFPLRDLVAEYRALRACVIRRWGAVKGTYDATDIDDLTRFNESIDQSLTRSVNGYTERVEQSRRMFLAVLGHDLRNPLGAITMSAQMLLRKGNLEPAAAGWASGISESGAAMMQMLGDLLDFTSAGLGSLMPLSVGPMDLAGLCDEVVREVRGGHPTRALEFEPSGDLTGDWDAGRLRQLLSNLLGNAMQHGAADEPAVLKADGEGAEVVLAVRNGGSPIPAGAVATIFDPLVRGVSPEAQASRRPGSLGLGLHIAREVARAHGGDIAVASSARAGTTFTVRLPRRHVTD